MRLLLLDTETSSIDPDTGHPLEVATAIYSVEHRSLTRVRSWLVQAPGNDAEPINGIPPAATDFDRARNELAKQHGFRFDDPTKTWRRRMPIEETSTLPFAVKEVAA